MGEADCHAVEGDTYCRINENDVAQRCDGLNSCQFWADAAGWRMGCSGYRDFLQVHYICVRSGELTSNIRAKSGLTKMMQKEDRASLETDDGMRTQMDTMKADISTLKATHEAMKSDIGELKATHEEMKTELESLKTQDITPLGAHVQQLLREVAALQSNNGQRWSEKRE